MEYVTRPPLDIDYTIVFYLITKGGMKGGFRKIVENQSLFFFPFAKGDSFNRQLFIEKSTLIQNLLITWNTLLVPLWILIIPLFSI